MKKIKNVTKPFMQNMKELLQLQQQVLHFSRELIKRLEIKGIRFAEVTLHTVWELSDQLKWKI